jgi:DNA-binding response OmpR family regulator
MRPRKRILLLCADEELAGRMAFVLDTKKFCVVRAHGAAAALAWLCRADAVLDLVLVELPVEGVDEVLALARGMHPEGKVLARTRGDEPPANLDIFDAWLPHTAGMAELVQRARILMVIKRGPKPAASCDVLAAPGAIVESEVA